MKSGKLIGVGVGPGDPQLLTLKAVEILKKIQVICAPRSSPKKPSLAFSIVKQFIHGRKDDYEVIEPLFPMIEDEQSLKKHWEEASKAIALKLNDGLDVAFITLGDPSVYSTFSYISGLIKDQGFLVEIIPGVSSFTGCAASCGISLGEKDEIIVVVPKIDHRLERILEHGDTFVIMKTSRHADLLEKIIQRDPRDKEIISVQNCGMKDEKIIKGFAEGATYLSTTLVKLKKMKDD